MTRHYLTSAAAIALALGMTAAAAQNPDQRRNADQGKQTDQVERNQRPQASGQSQTTPPQQRTDQDNRQSTQAPLQNPPSAASQNATGRQQGDRQPEPGRDQQQQQGAQQNAPVTSGPVQQDAREPQQGQGQQQGAREPQQGQNQQQGARQPQQGQRQQQGAREPQQGQNQQQGAQAPREGGDLQQGAKNEQPDKSGRIALEEREQMRIGDIIRQQRIQPVTNLNFSLSVGSTVPSSVRLARISGELADIFPNYRDFSFFVARQELVIVDSQSYGIVAFVPISSGSNVGMAPPRGDTGAVGTAAPPDAVSAPAKKRAARGEKKRVTVTEERPRGGEREIRRGPAQTETDVTVGTSRPDIDEFDEPAPRTLRMGPPVRERFEHHEHRRGPPFPFSLLFGR